MARNRTIATSMLAVTAAGLFVANTSVLVPAPSGRTELLAHRGVHQRFSTEGIERGTCTAARILPPTHIFIENTIPSIDAAFNAGADMVEFDIQPTRDGDFAVFHDRTVDCRTDGAGVTREKSLAELKALDAGHGYTADGGQSFPFRGRGIGLIPSLGEVLEMFPDRRFLIHIKSRDPDEGKLLAERLAQLPPEQRDLLTIYGADRPVGALKAALPDQRVAARGKLKACLLRYMAMGWTGYMPQACRNGVMFAPSNIAPWLWGWPHRLAARLDEANAKLVILGPYTGGDFSTGVDSAEQLAELPPTLPAMLWTNDIRNVALIAKRPLILPMAERTSD